MEKKGFVLTTTTKINNITKKDVYPLPRIDGCLNALGGAKFFSTFDLASGYWQIPMDPADIEKNRFYKLLWIVRVSSYALWSLQCPCNLPTLYG